MTKDEAYREGYIAGAARIAAKKAQKELGANGNAGMDFSELAKTVAKQLSRDNKEKQRILASSPHLARALDADELALMSATELARAEIKVLGIAYSNKSDPVEIRDAYHLGRLHERQGRAPSAGMDSTSDNVVSRYLKE